MRALVALCALALLAARQHAARVPLRVTVHMELFQPRLRLLHTGISFRNGRRCVRFDFRPFHDGGSYVTTATERRALRHLPPDLATLHAPSMPRRDAHWGVTDRTFDEILDFEATHLARRRYVLGVYDCRHYVSEFATWAVQRPLEVWRLHALWEAP